MTFQVIIKLLYVSSGYFKTQQKFLLDLLKGSVGDSDKISLSDSALKGFFQGNNITNLASQLYDAELSIDRISKYIETLYKKQHRDTPTYNEKFNGMTYKEALYERAKKKFPYITQDTMSTILAEKFYKILEDAYTEDNTTDSEIATEQLEENVICKENINTSSYSITELDKRVINNICRLMDSALSDIRWYTNRISNSQLKINRLTDSEVDQNIKEYLELDLASQKKSFNERYTELEQICSDYVRLYGAKKHLHICLKRIYDIANGINDNKYKITCPDEFQYSALSSVISNFKQNYNLLPQHIEKI